MALISSVIDQFRSTIAATLPTSTEIADSINLNMNADATLESGWGILLGEAIPSPLDELCKDVITQYSLSVIITKDTTRLQNDSAGFITALKDAHNDEILLRQALDKPNLLIGSSMAQVFFNGVTAPAFVPQTDIYNSPLNGVEKFIYIVTNYTIRTQD